MDYETAGGALKKIQVSKNDIRSLKESFNNQSVVKTNISALTGAINQTCSKLDTINNNLDTSETTIRGIMTKMRNIENKVKGVS